jgi:hypothetical protein
MSCFPAAADLSVDPGDFTQQLPQVKRGEKRLPEIRSSQRHDQGEIKNNFENFYLALSRNKRSRFSLTNSDRRYNAWAHLALI